MMMEVQNLLLIGFCIEKKRLNVMILMECVCNLVILRYRQRVDLKALTIYTTVNLLEMKFTFFFFFFFFSFFNVILCYFLSS